MHENHWMPPHECLLDVYHHVSIWDSNMFAQSAWLCEILVKALEISCLRKLPPTWQMLMVNC